MAARFIETSTALRAAAPQRLRALTCFGVFAALVMSAGYARAEADEEPLDGLEVMPVAEAPERALFSIDSPLGPFEYGVGRGLRIGNTGLNVGGFTTVEFDKEQGEYGELELDGVNLLILFSPNQYIRGFADLEFGDLFLWDTERDDVELDVSFAIERLYFDLSVGDPLSLRMGKFQTPIGRWNLVPAEPFVWTAEEPVFIEVMFDEHTTGGSFLGSTEAGGGTFEYWVYGAFFDPLYPDEDLATADHSVGTRFQYGQGIGNSWSIGGSFLATEIDADWSFLGGIDAEVRWERLLLTSELTLQQGHIADRDLWDFYVQSVIEIVPTLHLVGRYEHIDPSGREEDAHLGDLGVAWTPKPYLHFKATYRFTNKQTEEVRRGLSASFSIVF